MILALDELAEDNPILDELLFWMPDGKRIVSVRACSVMFRKPFIEVTLANGEAFQRHFERSGYAGYWAEASVVLQTLTDIEVISEFDFPPPADRDALVARSLACRERCIAEANEMFDAGMYEQYLKQFGENCRDLPAAALERIARARKMLDATP